VRISLGTSAIMLIGLFEFVGMLLALFLVGLDIWIPVLTVLVAVACFMQGLGAGSTLVMINFVLGIDFSIFLAGFPVWPSALIGVVAIAVIFSNFGKPSMGVEAVAQ
jgi:hypothetical protein